MHLLYMDESGSVHDPKQNFFVLAGISIFERQGFWLSQELDNIAARFNPADPASVELHGNPMMSGKGMWRNYPKEVRWAPIGKISWFSTVSIVTIGFFPILFQKRLP